MLKVQGYNTLPARVSFLSAERTEQDNSNHQVVKKTYKSNIGITTGAFASTLGLLEFVRGSVNFLYIPLFILTALGCGKYIDDKINNKNKEFADKLELEGKKAVLDNNDEAQITKKENVYYEPNIGKKIGPVMGAIALPALSAVQCLFPRYRVSPLVLLAAAIEGAIGGLALGAITDHFAAVGAAKFADKQNIKL